MIIEHSGKLVIPVLLYSPADPLHEILVIAEVVYGVEPCPQDLVALVEMVEVRPREVAAGIAAAGRIDGPHVVLVAAVPDPHRAGPREEVAVPGVPRRHHAVEHVDAAPYALDEVLRLPDTHQVAGERPREHLERVVEDMLADLLGLAYGKTADGVAVKPDLAEPEDGALPEVLIDAALHDAEERVGVLQPLELVMRPLRPAERHLHGLLRVLMGRGIGSALVEHHHDVGVQSGLDPHRNLWGEEHLVAVQGVAEGSALLG